MDERQLTKLLEQVRAGKVPVGSAVSKLKDLPFAELGYATLDTHRNLRFGFPEVVLWLPKHFLPESVGCFKNPSGAGYICP